VIEVSSRYALGMAIVTALALVPFLAHRGTRFLHEDCRDPSALLQPAASPDGGAPEVPEELRRLPRTHVGARRLPLAGGDGHLDLYLVQAFNPAVAYKPTELYFFGRTADARDVERVERDGESLPVHWAYYDRRGPGAQKASVAGYLLVFDSKPVPNPYLAALWAGPKQLFTGRRPFWVFFARGEVKWGERQAVEGVLREALASAWEEYRDACLPQPGSGA